MNAIRNFTDYNSDYLLADSFNSTSTSYETTQVASADVVLDLSDKIGMDVCINVDIEKLTAIGTETYGLKVQDGDAVGFGGLVQDTIQVVLKAYGTKQLQPPIVINVKYGFIRLQMIGANTPDWTVTSWAAPAE